jgi:hypothetical protein
MFSLAIFRVSKPNCGSSLRAGWPFVPHISPESAGLGLAVAGSKHRNRGVIGMNLGRQQYVPSDLLDQRSQQLAGRAHPTGQSGATQINAFTGKDVRMPVERQVIGIMWCTT